MSSTRTPRQKAAILISMATLFFLWAHSISMSQYMLQSSDMLLHYMSEYLPFVRIFAGVPFYFVFSWPLLVLMAVHFLFCLTALLKDRKHLRETAGDASAKWKKKGYIVFWVSGVLLLPLTVLHILIYQYAVPILVVNILLIAAMTVHTFLALPKIFTVFHLLGKPGQKKLQYVISGVVSGVVAVLALAGYIVYAALLPL